MKFGKIYFKMLTDQYLRSSVDFKIEFKIGFNIESIEKRANAAQTTTPLFSAIVAEFCSAIFLRN